MSVGSATWASGGGKVAVPILVRATLWAAIVVMTIQNILLSALLVGFPGIIGYSRNDGKNIVIGGEGWSIIRRNAF